MEASTEQIQPMGADERRRILTEAVRGAMNQGWQVQQQSEFSATLHKGKRPNHILHLILTIITAGLWAIVWIIVALTTKEQQRMMSVDEYGRIVG